jgi:hypothetical protein
MLNVSADETPHRSKVLSIGFLYTFEEAKWKIGLGKNLLKV